MNITELLDFIQKKTKKEANQAMLAKALDVTRQTINSRIKKGSEVTVSELKKVEEFFGISPSNTCDSHPSLTIEYYPMVFASCGNGTVDFSGEKETVSIPKDLFSIRSDSNKYSMIRAKGDSMSPTIDDGDKLLVKHWESNQITDNKIYVFSYKSEIFVKRLSKNLDEVMIKSDNPDYKLRTIQGEDINDINIIGEITGIIRSL